MCIANAPLISMLKLLPDPINNHVIHSFEQNKKVHATLIQDSLFFYDFVTKSIQNNQNLIG